MTTWYAKIVDDEVQMFSETPDPKNGIETEIQHDDARISDKLKPITDEEAKLAGVSILGVMCSATKDDQNGLNAIATGVTLARANSTTFPSTVFKFSNGNTLTITDANFDTVYATWVPFRQSFFSP